MGLRRTPLRSRGHSVTDEERAVYLAVEQRDGGCMAPRLDPTVDACSGRLTRQHVKAGPGAPRLTHYRGVLMLCWHHHLDGWATSKAALQLQREYLASVPSWPPLDG